MIRKLTLYLLTIVAIVLAFNVVCQAQSYKGGVHTRSLITQPVSDSRLVTLAGNTRSAANAENDRGPVPDSFPMEHMLLQLQRPPEVEQELASLIDEMHRPGSPVFHQWIMPQELGVRFGVSQPDMEKITDWLVGHGFQINRIYPTGMVIDFSGSAAQVRDAFHTEIHNLEVNGERHIANMRDPEIPAALAGAVKGVVSLHNFKPRQMYKMRSDYTFTSGTSTYYALVPADLATIYNLNPLFSAGYTGTGQTIVVIEDTNVYSTADWSTFRSTFGLSGYTSGSFTQVHPGGCTNPGVTSAEIEAALDAQWASAAAPNAAIELASCADTTTFGGLIALENLVSAGSPPAIMSMSYGECEADNGATSNAAFNSAYQSAVAAGVSVFVSAGDDGAAGCDPDATKATHGIGISGWASSVYNVAVGGTDFGDTYAGTNATYWNSSNTSTYGSAKSYIDEIPWNDSCASQLIATFSGDSTTYGSTGFCNSTTGEADYLSTGAGSGGPSGCATGKASTAGVVSGTCAGYAKPSWQSLVGNPSDGVRDIPDVSLFAANGVWGHYYVFCDTDPSDSGTCTGAPSAWLGAGGTSFASPIMAGIMALVNEKQGAAQGNPNPTLYSLAASEYGTTGSTTCNSSNGNAVGSSCIFYDVTQGDMDVNCTGTHNCYRPSGTNGVLSTSTSAYDPAYGTTTGWDFATGIGTVNAYNLVFGWSGTGDFTIVANPTTVSVAQGGNGTSTITTTISGNFNSAIALSATGQPTGVTVTFNPTSIAAPGNGTSTMTMTVGSATATGTYPITVTGTGGGKTHTTTVNLTVTASTTTTTTALTSSLNPSTVGASVTFTATVSPSPGAVGTMAFTSNGTTISGCSAVALTGGVATCTTSFSAAGTDSIVATYSGGTGFSGSTSNSVSQVVNKDTTTTGLTSSLNPSTVGASVTFTATVSGGSSPTGTVGFTSNGTAISGCTAVTLTSGTAACTTSFSAAGTDSIVATYSGDSNNSGSTSSTLSQVVNKTTTTTGLVSSVNPSTVGQSVTFTATVSGGSSPTGTVGFTSNGTAISGCSAVTLTSGTAACTTSFSAAGTDSIAATYSGDSNNSGSASSALSQVVNKATTTMALISSVNPSTVGQSVTFTATVSGGSSPTGTVGFTSNGTAISGCSAVTLSSGTAACTTSFATAGTYSIVAAYSGDGNNSGSTSSTLSQVVNSTGLISTTSVLADSPNPSTGGLTVTFTCTVSAASGPKPTGSVNFYNGSTSIGLVNLTSGVATLKYGSLLPGTHSMTCTYNGSTTDASSTSAVVTQTVTAEPTTTTLTSSPNPSTTTQPVTLTATVTAGNGVTPAGTVSFYSGTTQLGNATLSAGVATLSHTFTTAGTYSLTAKYTGSNYMTASTSSAVSQVVNTSTGTVTTTALVSSVNPSTTGQSVTFTATVSPSGSPNPTGTVGFTSNGATISGCTAVTLGSGLTAACTTSFANPATYSIVATYSGDSKYDGSTSNTVSQVVNASGTITTTSVLTDSPNPSTGGQTVTFTCTVSAASGPTPTGTVIFYNGSTSIGSIGLTAGVATLKSGTLVAGTHSMTCNYTGSSTDAASTSAVVTQTVTSEPTTTVLTASPNPSTTVQAVTLTATVTSGNGVTPAGTVSFYSGTTLLGNASLNGSGVATLSHTFTTTGTYSLTAKYTGSNYMAASTSTAVSQVVNPD